MIRRNAVPLCHCGELDTGVEHWSRCIVCHPEQYLGMVRSDRMVGWCELHRRTGAQCIAVAIYAGIVALGEWAAERARCVCHKCGHRMRTPNAWRLCGRCEEGLHQ